MVTILTVYELVRRKICAEAFIKDGKSEIKGIRCLLSHHPMDQGYAYAGHSEQFGMETPGKSVIYQGGDYILSDVSVSELLNEAMEAVEKLLSLQNSLYQAVLTRQPFQAVADVVYEKIHCCIAIHNNYFRVLGIAGESSCDSFQYMKENKTNPPFFMDKFSESPALIF